MTSQQDDTWHYRPDQMVVATELPETPEASAEAYTLVRESLEQELGSDVFTQRAPQPADTLVFTTPDPNDGRPPLAFLLYDFANPRPGLAKQHINRTQANGFAALQKVRQNGLNPVGVMPTWLASAQQDYSDGSPASYPRPTDPRQDGKPNSGSWRYRYNAVDAGLDLRARLMQIDSSRQVPVLILDTHPDWHTVKHQAAAFAPYNAQLADLVNWLEPTSELAPWHLAALEAYNASSDTQPHPIALKKGPDKRRGDQDIRDHALFVAGLIHDLSPLAPLHIRPVLNSHGVGDLWLLLRVLHDVISSKPPEDPLVVNMSLGFAPKIEHLPWLWFGVDKPNDDEFVGDVPIEGETHDVRSLVGRVGRIEETTRLLHVSMDRLYEYLLANNCLPVAAAGNDSLKRVIAGKPRLGPRIPARYHSVLGVAATLKQPTHAAVYSNAGDDWGFNDHVATFGGDIQGDGEPEQGVIGVYTAPNFPGPEGQKMHNTDGWAMWSGTSFATAIASGLASAYWTNRLNSAPNTNAQDVLFDFNDQAQTYVASLRARSIEVQGDWELV
jgi:hypothetical protein